MKYLLLAFLPGLGFPVVNGEHPNARHVNMNRRAAGECSIFPNIGRY